MWGLILLTMAVLYIIEIVWTYYSLNEFSKEQKLLYLIGGNLLMLLITFLFMMFNQVQLENEAAQKAINLANLFVFAPLNSLILLPQIARTINKVKGQQIRRKTAEKRILIWLIIFCLILFFEVGYIKDFGIMLENMSKHQIT